MPFYTSATLPRNTRWSSDGSSPPPPPPPPPFSSHHHFATLARPSYKSEESQSASRLQYDDPPPFFSYPMQLQPALMMHNPQQNQQMLQYVPQPQQQQLQLAQHPAFPTQIAYNPPLQQHHAMDPQQMWAASASLPPSYGHNNNPQVVYFSPYTAPPAAFLPSKNDSYSDEDYDPFPSDCYQICCSGFTQLLCIVFFLLFIAIIAGFLLGLFSL